LEPYLSGVRSELARLTEADGGDPEEVRRLREAEVELLTRDARLLPEESSPLYQRGMLLYLLGRLDEARESFDEACRIHPNAYENWLALSLICERQQDWPRALEALGHMYKIRPEDPAIRGILQRIQQAGGLPEKPEMEEKE
jgi:tetratricopeptide (TPR) repeat protein